jgi:uncharacterized protein YqeY
MPTKETFEADLKQAIRERHRLRKNVIRGVLSAIQLKEIEVGQPVDEASLLSLLHKEVNSRQETIEAAQQAGRPQMEETLRQEIDILESYLPQRLSELQLEELVREVIQQTGAESMADMGLVMRTLMPRIAGRADGRAASEMARALLSG